MNNKGPRTEPCDKPTERGFFDEIGISSLRDRRLRGDLIQYYKIHEGFNNVTWVNTNQSRPALLTSGPASSVRASNHAVQRQLVRNCDPRENFFSNRVVPFWNALPDSIVNTTSVNAFKNQLDIHLRDNKKFFATAPTSSSTTSTIADRA